MGSARLKFSVCQPTLSFIIHHLRIYRDYHFSKMNCFSKERNESMAKFRKKSFALDSLAKSSDSFQKTYDGVLKKKSALTHLEEYGVFLRKCLHHDVLPYKGELTDCSTQSHKRMSFVELYLAEKEN